MQIVKYQYHILKIPTFILQVEKIDNWKNHAGRSFLHENLKIFTGFVNNCPK